MTGSRTPGAGAFGGRRIGGVAAFFLAFSLGAAANVAFAPLHFWPVLMIAYSGLLLILDDARSTKRPIAAGFARAWAFAAGFFGIGLSWVGNAFLVDAETYGAFIWLGIVVLPGGLALLWGLGGAAYAWSKARGAMRPIAFAAAIGFSEAARTHLFGGFPWNMPGTAWPPGGAVSQTAALIGASGLSLLTLLAFSSPAALVGDGRTRLTLRVAPVLVGLALFAFLWTSGARRLAAPDPPVQDAIVRVVDIGVPQAEKWDRETRLLQFERFLELSGPPSARREEIVIWPEGALPILLLEDAAALDRIGERLGERTLLTGVIRRQPRQGDAPDDFFNTLAVITEETPTLDQLQVYDKHRLVPFGEFVPFSDLFARLGFASLQQVSGGYKAGVAPYPIDLRGAPPFAPLICFEVLFPGLAPSGPDRPRWLVNVSIDGWFGRGSGPAQHFAQARYRAIETGLPLARAASGGVSGVVDAKGRIVVVAPAVGDDPLASWRAHAGQTTLPGALAETAYSRNGDLFYWAFLVTAVFFVAFARQRVDTKGTDKS